VVLARHCNAWRGDCFACPAKPEITMKAQHKWIIVLVAHDDPEIQTRVIKERLAIAEDEQLAAFLRGGELVMVMERGSESAAEAQRIEVEKTCLR